MAYRTILCFPKFENDQWIQQTRQQYDPLAELIPYHITLVFPFEEDMTQDDLKYHIIDHIQDFRPFTVTFSGLQQAEEYIFLQMRKGNQHIVELHDALYQNGLSKHLRKDIPYVPHITLGRLADAETASQVISELQETAIEEYSCVIDRICVEEIGPNEESIILFEIPL
ncbi:2'-5' RNA ligase family protein [Streptococcus cameli]